MGYLEDDNQCMSVPSDLEAFRSRVFSIRWREGRELLLRVCDRPLRAVVIISATAIGAVVALGDDVSAPFTPVKFSIPAQALVDALQSYSMQTGIQVMFVTSSAAGYRSVKVEGDFTPEAALQLLLADTDLRIRYTRTSAVTLAPASAPNPDEPPTRPLATVDLSLDTLRVTGASEGPNRALTADYINSVQMDIQNALKGVVRNRKGNYRVAVKLWINTARAIQRIELDGSTGDPDHDRLIVSTLHGLVLSQQAPANTPQPMRFMIGIQSL